MRLRTLIAPTMGQAMDMLRRELGDDAMGCPIGCWKS